MARAKRRPLHLALTCAALMGCGDDPSPSSNQAGTAGSAGNGSAGATAGAGAAPYVREEPAHKSPAVDVAAPLTPKVMSLLAALTLEEKHKLIHGNAANPGVDRGFLRSGWVYAWDCAAA